MPVRRSFQLKMCFSRDNKSNAVKRNLWFTHETINTAVRELKDNLLLMRGDFYRDGDDKIVDKTTVQKKALDLAKEAQKTIQRVTRASMMTTTQF